ncbi:unnamed protein product [Rotaria sp. Silwood1]|nr:unnamed protein product [Rotaria sp. Silwood1]
MAEHLKNSQSSSAVIKLPSSPISPLGTKNQRLETFQLVWLDPNVETDAHNQATYKNLQQILTNVRKFTDCNACEQWLKNYCAKEKIILIVSGKFGQVIMPHIHDLESIVAIYIYCLKSTRYEAWARKYSKICSVVTVMEDLMQHLSSYQKDLESVEDSKAIQVFQGHHHKSGLNSKNATFIWYQLLLEILISSSYLPSRDTFSQLIQILRQYCAENAYHLASIDEFTQTYNAKRAILCIMHDTPVTRFINKALREQDIHILFLLRFFLNDIYFRLTARPTHALSVYKLQLMSAHEIEYLKTNRDQYLFFTGFLCASSKKPDLQSVNIDNNQFQTVLLEIDAYPHTGTSPFACFDETDILVDDKNKNNVLFMCGSIFRIGSLKQIHTSKYTLQLTLADGKDLTLLTNMKRQLRQNGDLCVIGDLLESYDQHDKAIMYYRCLLRELPAHHVLVSRLQEKLNKISKVKSSTYLFFKQ